MSCLCVIPARLNSSRFPEKVLAFWQGKTILQHTWEKACQAKGIDQVLIACDHEKTYKVAKSFGAEVKMTSFHHQTGSDRVGEVLSQTDSDYCINLQADEPEMDPDLLSKLVECLVKHPCADCATVLGPPLLHLNEVKVVTNYKGQALYFSRALNYGYRHVGIYAYRRSALFRFLDLPQGRWELAESLEQLRLLEAGMLIQTVWSEYRGISIDTPEDLERLCLS